MQKQRQTHHFLHSLHCHPHPCEAFLLLVAAAPPRPSQGFGVSLVSLCQIETQFYSAEPLSPPTFPLDVTRDWHYDAPARPPQSSLSLSDAATLDYDRSFATRAPVLSTGVGWS